jgi:hypothetical protein
MVLQVLALILFLDFLLAAREEDRDLQELPDMLALTTPFFSLDSR